jgi:hypothetical protein
MTPHSMAAARALCMKRRRGEFEAEFFMVSPVGVFWFELL